jgi:hypothetical protein
VAVWVPVTCGPLLKSTAWSGRSKKGASVRQARLSDGSAQAPPSSAQCQSRGRPVGDRTAGAGRRVARGLSVGDGGYVRRGCGPNSCAVGRGPKRIMQAKQQDAKIVLFALELQAFRFSYSFTHTP